MTMGDRDRNDTEVKSSPSFHISDSAERPGHTKNVSRPPSVARRGDVNLSAMLDAVTLLQGFMFAFADVR